MKTPEVQKVCVELWDARAKEVLIPADSGRWSARLIDAAQADHRSNPNYEVPADARFMWAIAVLDRLRIAEPKPMAGVDLEAMAAFLLEKREAVVSGRDLAVAD